MRKVCLLGCATLVLLGGCGSSDDNTVDAKPGLKYDVPVPNPGIDTAPAEPDGGGTVPGIDSAPQTTPDVGSGIGLDGAVMVKLDGAAAGALDTGTDAGFDSATGSGPDGKPDLGPNTNPDGGDVAADLSIADVLIPEVAALDTSVDVSPNMFEVGHPQGGVLDSSGVVSGRIDKGEIDTFTMVVNAGETVQLRMTDVAGGSLQPELVVYDPTGTQVTYGQGADVAYILFQAAKSGTYTISASDSTSGHAATGDYLLYYAKSPGANEGGLLDASGVVSGTIDEGDIDSYTMAVNAGETVQLRMTDVAGGSFQPLLVVYDPTGAQVTYGLGADVAYILFEAAKSGTYTILAYDSTSGHAETGAYQLYYAKSPGANEGGLLDASGVVSGTIDEGDIDSYTMAVNAGETVQLRMTDVAGGSFQPLLVVYDPTGAQVTYGLGADVAYILFEAAKSGTYTILAYDSTSGHAETGAYQLYYAKSPGANEGGLLDASGVVSGTIDEGDIDSYTMAVNAGETVQLRMTDVAGGSFQPLLVVYDPTGAQVTYGLGADVAYILFEAAKSGTYTILAYDSTSGHAETGAYQLYYAKSPGANEGGLLNPGDVVSGTIDEGDIDSFTISVSAGKTAHLRMTDVAGGALQPLLVVYDPTGAQVTYGSAADVADLTFNASVTGVYTVLAYDSTSGHAASGDYTLLFERTN